MAGTSPIALRMAAVLSEASWFSSGVVIWMNATFLPACWSGPALPPSIFRAARRAAASALTANAGDLVEPRSACTTSVKAPSPRSLKRSFNRSRPRSASDPGTLKRLVSRSPRPDAAVPPSTKATTHAAITFLRWLMMNRVQRAKRYLNRPDPSPCRQASKASRLAIWGVRVPSHGGPRARQAQLAGGSGRAREGPCHRRRRPRRDGAARKAPAAGHRRAPRRRVRPRRGRPARRLRCPHGSGGLLGTSLGLRRHPVDPGRDLPRDRGRPRALACPRRVPPYRAAPLARRELRPAGGGAREARPGGGREADGADGPDSPHAHRRCRRAGARGAAGRGRPARRRVGDLDDALRTSRAREHEPSRSRVHRRAAGGARAAARGRHEGVVGERRDRRPRQRLSRARTPLLGGGAGDRHGTDRGRLSGGAPVVALALPRGCRTNPWVSS